MEKIFECKKDCVRVSENGKPYKKGDAMSVKNIHVKALRRAGVIGQFDQGKTADGKPTKPAPVKTKAKAKAKAKK
jgi:hypothetical protein